MNQPELSPFQSPFPVEPASLSAEGCARRDRMLGEILPAVHARRRRRRATMAAGAALPVLLVGVLAWALRPLPPQASPDGHQGPTAQTPARPEAPAGVARASLIIHDRPELLERTVVRGDPALVARISDDELLALLAEAGEPTGLIRTRGQALVAADVRGAAEPGAEPSGRLPNDPPGPGSDGPATGVRLAAAYSRR